MSLPLLLPALATRYSLLLPDGLSSCLVGHLGCGGGRSGVDVGRTEKDTFSLILSEFQICWVSAKGAAVRMWETEALRGKLKEGAASFNSELLHFYYCCLPAAPRQHLLSMKNP